MAKKISKYDMNRSNIKVFFASQSVRILALVIIVGLFAHKYYDGMILDATLYSAIAKNMALSGNFLLPSFSPYYYSYFFDHPPLFFWLMAIVFKIFGISTFTARLVPMISGATLIIILYWFVKRFFDNRIAIFSVLVLVLNTMFFKYSSMAMMDVPLTVVLFLYACIFYYSLQTQNTRIQWLMGFCLGAGLLLKGPIVLGIPVAIIIFSIYTRKFSYVFNLYFFIHIFIAIGCISLWLVPLSLKNWDVFYNDYIIAQLKNSLLGNRGADERGFITYNLLFIETMHLWLIPFGVCIYKLIKDSKRNHLLIFLLICFLVYFLPFVVLKIRRLPHYLIYTLPFFAVLAASGMTSFSQSFQEKLLKIVQIGFIIYALALLLFPINIKTTRNVEVFYFGNLIKSFKLEQWGYYLEDGSYYMWNFHPINKFYFSQNSQTASLAQIASLMQEKSKTNFFMISSERKKLLATQTELHTLAICRNYELLSNQPLLSLPVHCE